MEIRRKKNKRIQGYTFSRDTQCKDGTEFWAPSTPLSPVLSSLLSQKALFCIRFFAAARPRDETDAGN
jgi:hypothetical protein